MPMYDYHCPACGHKFELNIKYEDRNHVECPQCLAKDLCPEFPLPGGHMWTGARTTYTESKFTKPKRKS